MIVETVGATAPLACNLSGSEQQARGGEVSALFAAVQQVEELTDGYGFAFPGDASTAGNLLDFVLTERACCPFFTFALVFAPDHRRIWLHLRGSAEIKALIAQDWLPGHEKDLPLGRPRLDSPAAGVTGAGGEPVDG